MVMDGMRSTTTSWKLRLPREVNTEFVPPYSTVEEGDLSVAADSERESVVRLAGSSSTLCGGSLQGQREIPICSLLLCLVLFVPAIGDDGK